MQFSKNSFMVLSALILSILGFIVQPALAVDSVTLKPDSDITFTNPDDSKTIYVTVSPAEAGVTLIIDADTSVVNVSAATLTTDADGKASFVISPGKKKDMIFLPVSAEGEESNAIIVKNDIAEPSTLTISPEKLMINWNDNPNSRATITLDPPQISNITIHNNDPNLITVPTAMSTDSSGSTNINIIANRGGKATLYATLPDGTVSNTVTIAIYTDDFIVTSVSKVEVQTGESTQLEAFDLCGRKYLKILGS